MTEERVTIRSVRHVGPETIAIDLETPNGFEPTPGQFVKLTAFVDGEHVVRFYTMSSPDAEETFELTVGIEPDGVLGPWLEDAEGETVQIEGPYGHAAYDGESRSVILASGPGLGAAIGVAERAHADDNEAVIIFQGDTPPHQRRLDALRTVGIPVEVTEDVDIVSAYHTGDEQIFVYGFQQFVTEAIAAIEAIGYDPAEAKIENYG